MKNIYTVENFDYYITDFNLEFMKKLLFIVFFAGVFLSACKSNTENRFDGWIIDATMNTVTVKALTRDDTHVFTLKEADKSEANGLLRGNLISVTYKGKLSEITPATKVATDATYAKAVGKWIMPDSTNAAGTMGVELMLEGRAASINMATSPIESWELQGETDKIILKGKSIGNGQTTDFSQIARIIEKDGKMFLDIEGVMLEKME